MLVFVIFQIPIVLAKNYATVLVFRFLTGFFGAPPLSGGGAALCDLYDSLHVPYALG
jgi:DHA1 family multidrug resistance protein-like MFS transporter